MGQRGEEVVLGAIGRFRVGARGLLAGQHAREVPLGLLLGRDVARDLGGAHDAPVRVADRGHGEGDVEQASVLADPDRLEVIDLQAVADATQDPILLVVAVGRDDQRDVPPDRLLRGPAEHALGRLVPRLDHPVDVLAHDRVVGGFHDGRETGRHLLDLLLGRDVAHVHGDARAGGIEVDLGPRPEPGIEELEALGLAGHEGAARVGLELGAHELGGHLPDGAAADLAPPAAGQPQHGLVDDAKAPLAVEDRESVGDAFQDVLNVPLAALQDLVERADRDAHEEKAPERDLVAQPREVEGPDGSEPPVDRVQGIQDRGEEPRPEPANPRGQQHGRVGREVGEVQPPHDRDDHPGADGEGGTHHGDAVSQERA